MPRRGLKKKMQDGGKTPPKTKSKGDKLIEKKLDKTRKIVGTPRTKLA